MELNPNSYYVVESYSWFLLYVGRHSESIAIMERIGKSNSRVIDWNLDWIYWNCGRCEDQLAYLKKYAAIDTSIHAPNVETATCYAFKGKCKEALAILESLKAQHRLGETEGSYAYAVCGAGRDRALRSLDILEAQARREYIDPYWFTCIYAALGDRDQAFAWLKRAFEVRSPQILALRVDLLLNPLRSDPRFDECLRKVGFPESKP